VGDASWDTLRANRLAGMSEERRSDYDAAYTEATLAAQLARLVYDARVSAGITQAELARRMGSHQSVVARIENAGTVPSLNTLDRLARALGMHLQIGVRAGEQAPEILQAG